MQILLNQQFFSKTGLKNRFHENVTKSKPGLSKSLNFRRQISHLCRDNEGMISFHIVRIIATFDLEGVCDPSLHVQFWGEVALNVPRVARICHSGHPFIPAKSSGWSQPGRERAEFSIHNFRSAPRLEGGG